MGDRGRESKAELTVAKANATPIERPAPPADITNEQKIIWVTIVNRMPADWFPPETHGTLIQLCRHRVRARRLAQLVEDMEGNEDFDVKAYRDLIRSEGENTRIIESCETKLRLTPQSTYDKSKKKGSSVKRPWES